MYDKFTIEPKDDISLQSGDFVRWTTRTRKEVKEQYATVLEKGMEDLDELLDDVTYAISSLQSTNRFSVPEDWVAMRDLQRRQTARSFVIERFGGRF